MRIDAPLPSQIPGLKQLWKLAFGDSDEDIEAFFALGFAPERCRCITVDGAAAAALYWFDTRLEDQHFAYLYAVATHPDYRRRGFCRALMEDTLQLLGQSGFIGAILKPENAALADLYAAMGFRPGTTIREFTAQAAGDSLPLHEISPAAYAARRQEMLPQGGILQDGADLSLLASQIRFYAGEDFLLAAAPEAGILRGTELLGNADAAPGILAALGAQTGTFRTPGSEMPFTMVFPLTKNCPNPTYFAFVLD